MAKPIPAAVLYPCLAAITLVLLVALENLLWYTGDWYPAALTQARYVNDSSLLTPQAVRDICSLPLTTPELVNKRNGLYLRCGIPGIEGVYRIERYVH